MTDLTGKQGIYALDKPSQKAGEVRNAIVLKDYQDGTVNLVVTLQNDDFKKQGRVFGIDEIGRPVIVGRVVIDDSGEYLYINKVAVGFDNGEWNEQ